MRAWKATLAISSALMKGILPSAQAEKIVFLYLIVSKWPWPGEEKFSVYCNRVSL